MDPQHAPGPACKSRRWLKDWRQIKLPRMSRTALLWRKLFSLADIFYVFLFFKNIWISCVQGVKLFICWPQLIYQCCSIDDCMKGLSVDCVKDLCWPHEDLSVACERTVCWLIDKDMFADCGRPVCWLRKTCMLIEKNLFVDCKKLVVCLLNENPICWLCERRVFFDLLPANSSSCYRLLLLLPFSSSALKKENKREKD